ncbi:MAG: TetR/AcrR family transcriptional regulator [Ferrovibrio sp.]|jgi:TetR/AcrR family transcriptional repressor of lmrAB and yxaGH operons|nr:TetR/AcrR family transcriptional regulator [Ferrovibrio sp.]
MAKRTQSSRDRFVEMAAKLFSRHGYAAVGLNRIIEKSGAPKGSLYHHFPDGKEQLAAEAVAWAAESFTETLRAEIDAAPSVAVAIWRTADRIAGWLEKSGFRDGSPLTIVAVETGAFNAALREACRQGYAQWAAILSAALLAEGRSEQRAEARADLILAAFEGAMILCRVQASGEPLRGIGRQLEEILQ